MSAAFNNSGRNMNKIDTIIAKDEGDSARRADAKRRLIGWILVASGVILMAVSMAAGYVARSEGKGAASAARVQAGAQEAPAPAPQQNRQEARPWKN